MNLLGALIVLGIVVYGIYRVFGGSRTPGSSGRRAVKCPICKNGRVYDDGTYDGRQCPTCGGTAKIPG